MRVAYVIPTPRLPCGVHEYTTELAGAMAVCGTATTVIDGGHGPVLDKLAALPHADLLHLQFGYYLYPPDYLARILTAARARGWPVAVTMHGFRPDFREHHRILSSVPVIVHSPRMSLGMMQCGFDSSRTVTLQMPCPEPLPGSEPGGPVPYFRREAPRLGYFGFLLPHKGLLQMLHALALLKGDYPSLQATILSSLAPFEVSEAYFRRVQSVLATWNRPDWIEWETGFLPREIVMHQLSRCLATVFPYEEHTEAGVSYAARIALAAVCPVITTEASFFDGLEDDAIRVSGSDPVTLAAGIRRVLSCPRTEQYYRARAWAHARRFSWSSAAADHDSLYRRVIAQKGFSLL